MALSFSEGSIGGDIERVNLDAARGVLRQRARDAPGAGGRASCRVGADAARTASRSRRRTPPTHHALLLINPHTSFFFRSELQMTSDEGLNAYGAVDLGPVLHLPGLQRRAPAGCTPRAASTTSTSTSRRSTKKGDGFVYKYGSEERPVTVERRSPCRTRPRSGMAQKEFTVYRTHHGPIVREADGKWVAIRLMQEPVKALTQSYTRTKARDYADVPQDDGAAHQLVEQHDLRRRRRRHRLLPPQLHPASATRSFDWTKPVDGSDPATDWQGLLSVDETPHLLNPPSGWLYNTNNWPWSAAGPNSPKKADYPAYVETRRREPRAAFTRIRVLEQQEGLHARRR